MLYYISLIVVIFKSEVSVDVVCLNESTITLFLWRHQGVLVNLLAVHYSFEVEFSCLPYNATGNHPPMMKVA